MSMQISINIIHKAAAAVLALFLAAGCITEKDGPSMDVKDVMILLNVSADQMQTKAMDEDAIRTIRIFAFDQDGNKVGHVYSSEPGSGAFHMILSVPEGKTSMTVDFYAVANEGAMYYESSPVSLNDNMTVGELNGLVYNSLITTIEALPMYGKIEDRTLSLTSGGVHTVDNHTGFLLTDKVSIGLSRSLAKIGVYAAAKGTEGNPSTDPVIHSITLKAAGRRDVSYLFPAADLASLQTRDASVSSLPEDRVFSLAAEERDRLSNGGAVSRRLQEQNTETDITVTDLYTEILSPFYLAEVPYGSTSWDAAADESGRPVVLVVEYSLGEGTLRKYAEVNMPPVERNNFYQVRCLIKSDGQILVNVSVKPWEAGEDWDLVFDFPTHSDPLLKTGTYDPETGKYADHVYGTEANMYFTGSSDNPEEDGAFSVDFNMSYPIGGTWTPLISDASNTDFEIRLYERGGTEALTDQKIQVTDETADKWYTIKVVPLKSENVGKKVTLQVSYTPAYLDGGYSYLLQINGGEEDDLAWDEQNPAADDVYEASTVDIVITQVDAPSTGN